MRVACCNVRAAGIVQVRSPERAHHNLRLTPAVRAKPPASVPHESARYTREAIILFDDSTAHNLDSATSTSVAEETAASSEGSTQTTPTPAAQSAQQSRQKLQDEKPALSHRRLRRRARDLHHRERRSRQRRQRPQGHGAEAHRHPRGGGYRRQVRRHAAALPKCWTMRASPGSSPATKST